MAAITSAQEKLQGGYHVNERVKVCGELCDAEEVNKLSEREPVRSWRVNVTVSDDAVRARDEDCESALLESVGSSLMVCDIVTVHTLVNECVLIAEAVAKVEGVGVVAADVTVINAVVECTSELDCEGVAVSVTVVCGVGVGVRVFGELLSVVE